jgi:hypothetical protein
MQYYNGCLSRRLVIFNKAIRHFSNLTLTLNAKKSAQNCAPLILPHNLGPSLIVNHKKKLGVIAINLENLIFEFNKGSFGNFYLVAIQKNWLEIF